MKKKYQNKYRIETTRLANWNYGWEAAYFITICTHQRLHYFGKVVQKKMQLSPLGEWVEMEWLKTPHLRPDMNLGLGAFVVMPDHFHAILVIGANPFNSNFGSFTNVQSGDKPTDHNADDADDARDADDAIRDAMHRVSMGDVQNPNNGQHAPSFPNSTFPRSRSGRTKNKFGPQSKNLASIIRGFKSAVTTNARKSQMDFAWQARFHAHIIRNKTAYERIAHYIRKNPEEWRNNKFSQKFYSL